MLFNEILMGACSEQAASPLKMATELLSFQNTLEMEGAWLDGTKSHTAHQVSSSSLAEPILGCSGFARAVCNSITGRNTTVPSYDMGVVSFTFPQNKSASTSSGVHRKALPMLILEDQIQGTQTMEQDPYEAGIVPLMLPVMPLG